MLRIFFNMLFLLVFLSLTAAAVSWFVSFMENISWYKAETLVFGEEVVQKRIEKAKEEQDRYNKINEEWEKLQNPGYAVSKAETIGNHSFLRIAYTDFFTSEKMILLVLDTFEKTHPNLEITSWQTRQSQNTHREPIISGLFIDHKEKK